MSVNHKIWVSRKLRFLLTGLPRGPAGPEGPAAPASPCNVPKARDELLNAPHRDGGRERGKQQTEGRFRVCSYLGRD